MEIIYDGPYEQVEVPTLNVIATRGEPISVSEEDGKRLCEQEHWRSTRSSGRPRKTEENA
jgi:hypothetical protein